MCVPGTGGVVNFGEQSRGDGPLPAPPVLLPSPPCTDQRPQQPPLSSSWLEEDAGLQLPPLCCPWCSCLPVVHADYYECHHLVRHVDIIIFS